MNEVFEEFQLETGTPKNPVNTMNVVVDDLTKPVNPSQILLTLKKNIHKKEIVAEHATSTYRSEFGRIGMQINDSYQSTTGKKSTKLVYWELELSEAENGMEEMLQMQKSDANNTFNKYIKRNYQSRVR